MSFPGHAKYFKKREVIKSFFAYLREQLPEATLSIDLFGQSTVNQDDLGIGQIAEIRATQDALKENYVGFMLWNPLNIYTKNAVLKP